MPSLVLYCNTVIFPISRGRVQGKGEEYVIKYLTLVLLEYEHILLLLYYNSFRPVIMYNMS